MVKSIQMIHDPTTLPWSIRLDKYVDGQTYAGRTDFVVRGNNTETSLNEALALALLREAEVPAQQSAFVKFTVNGSDAALRLVIDLPDDDQWNEDEFGGTGVTYKAQSEGDYSYRGGDIEAYTDIFEQKFGDDDLEPLITFLDFINNSTDEEFANELSNYLDVDAFATYLAMQDLVANTDDIDGPGNNSYLHYDPDTGLMTVVAWDHNLAFGGFGGRGMGQGVAGERPGMAQEQGQPGQRPATGDFPAMSQGPTGDIPRRDEIPEAATGTVPPATPQQAGRGGPGRGSTQNVLVTRFKANSNFASLLSAQKEKLSTELVDSGLAEKLLEQYAQLLQDSAAGLVSTQTVENEAASIRQAL